MKHNDPWLEDDKISVRRAYIVTIDSVKIGGMHHVRPGIVQDGTKLFWKFPKDLYKKFFRTKEEADALRKRFTEYFYRLQQWQLQKYMKGIHGGEKVPNKLRLTIPK